MGHRRANCAKWSLFERVSGKVPQFEGMSRG